jgi:hypothetical protein
LADHQPGERRDADVSDNPLSGAFDALHDPGSRSGDSVLGDLVGANDIPFGPRVPIETRAPPG